MREKDLINAIKDAAESVRLLDQQCSLARDERAKAFLAGANEGMTYGQIAKHAGVSIHTVQTELRAARGMS